VQLRTWRVAAALGVGLVLLAAPSHASIASSNLSTDLGTYLHTRNDTVSVGVFDERTGRSYSYRPASSYDNASIVKVNILQTVLWQAQLAYRGLTPWELGKAEPMIRQSSNDAATALWNHVGGRWGVAAYDRTLALQATTFDAAGHWGLTRSVVADQLRLIAAVHLGRGPLTPVNRTYVRLLMSQVQSDQRWGVSAGVPANGVELKNGWLLRATHQWRVNSIGHVNAQGRRYAIAILTTDNDSMAYGVATISQVSRIVYRDLIYVPPPPAPSPSRSPTPTPAPARTSLPTPTVTASRTGTSIVSPTTTQ
jgi:hypothetical protein